MTQLTDDIADITYKPSHVRILLGILAALAIFLTHTVVVEQYQIFIYIVVGMVFSLGFFIPTRLYGLYKYWMIMSMMIGLVVSTVIFTILFFVGFSFIGLLMKLFNQLPLDLAWKSTKRSYWTPRNKHSSSLEKQY